MAVLTGTTAVFAAIAAATVLSGIVHEGAAYSRQAAAHLANRTVAASSYMATHQALVDASFAASHSAILAAGLDASLASVDRVLNRFELRGTSLDLELERHFRPASRLNRDEITASNVGLPDTPFQPAPQPQPEADF